MTDHHQHQGDSSPSISTDAGGPDGPELRGQGKGVRLSGVVDAALLRPRRRALGRPRVSTVTLTLVWIALFALYLWVHPG
ncbi:hypothetical protein [Nocardia aurantia]|uniref:Uncharacterized protein n=1 Tax=Nocardia aurantia TaxID=2585199 RepID=A0A7K0E0A7_9NOCA|nr:hypothetical protein [Nocardia aurantia]MQY31238.1 hypothetical protein [Nocardia aurantia]